MQHVLEVASGEECYFYDFDFLCGEFVFGLCDFGVEYWLEGAEASQGDEVSYLHVVLQSVLECFDDGFCLCLWHSL